jgi:glycosyltransferase involved in cell wall biosynthesis
MPVVSVILAFHRVTPFLRPAVRSILDQTMGDFELLLLDNGTGQGLAALGDDGRDPRIRLLSHPTNRGVPASVNAGCAAATGEFIALMDSDDLALPDRFARQLAVLRAEPALALLATHARVVDEAGAVIGPQFTLATEAEQREYSNYSLPITNPTVMGRRAVFLAFPWREEFPIGSDYDFFARVIERHPCRALPEVLLHYRRHGGQITVSRFAEMVQYASMVRLVTARRRAGRPEGLAELAAIQPARERTPGAAETYGAFAERAMADGFPLLAVFLGRRHFSHRRTPAGLARATWTLLRALAAAPGRAGSLLRMFLTGPLRTHNLRPL